MLDDRNCEISLQKRNFWGLNHAEKDQGMSIGYRDGVRSGPPTVNVTAQRVLRSSPVLAMLF